MNLFERPMDDTDKPNPLQGWVPRMENHVARLVGYAAAAVWIAGVCQRAWLLGVLGRESDRGLCVVRRPADSARSAQ